MLLKSLVAGDLDGDGGDMDDLTLDETGSTSSLPTAGLQRTVFSFLQTAIGLSEGAPSAHEVRGCAAQAVWPGLAHRSRSYCLAAVPQAAAWAVPRAVPRAVAWAVSRAGPTKTHMGPIRDHAAKHLCTSRSPKRAVEAVPERERAAGQRRAAGPSHCSAPLSAQAASAARRPYLLMAGLRLRVGVASGVDHAHVREP